MGRRGRIGCRARSPNGPLPLLPYVRKHYCGIPEFMVLHADLEPSRPPWGQGGRSPPARRLGENSVDASPARLSMAVTGYEPPSNGACSRHDPCRPRSHVVGRTALLRLKRACMNPQKLRTWGPGVPFPLRAWRLKDCVDKGCIFIRGSVGWQYHEKLVV